MFCIKFYISFSLTSVTFSLWITLKQTMCKPLMILSYIYYRKNILPCYDSVSVVCG